MASIGGQHDVTYPEVVQTCDSYLRQRGINPYAYGFTRSTSYTTAFSNHPIIRDCHKNEKHSGDFSMKRHENLIAMKIQLTGDLAPQRCTNCAKGCGMWKECVISKIPAVQTSTRGACANCYYNGKARLCSFRRPNGRYSQQLLQGLADSPNIAIDVFLKINEARRQILWDRVPQLEQTGRALEEGLRRHREVLRTTRTLAAKDFASTRDLKRWVARMNTLLQDRRLYMRVPEDARIVSEAHLEDYFNEGIERLGNDGFDVLGARQMPSLDYQDSCDDTREEDQVIKTGHKYPNITRIPSGPPNINDTTRVVQIGYRTVGGVDLDSKINWLRSALLGKSNVGDTSEPPNPICHWCVVVGDYYHQLQASGDFPRYYNWYDNDRLESEDGWVLFEVGETDFNDVAIKNAGDYSIHLMPEEYNAYNNNCQTFIVTLLNQICRKSRVRVTTSYATTQANYLPDMEADADDEGRVQVAVPEGGVNHTSWLDEIKDLMDANTPALTEDEIAKAKAAGEKGKWRAAPESDQTL